MTTVHQTDVVLIKPSDIAPHPDNPRGKLRAIPELAASIDKLGVLEPITVIRQADGAAQPFMVWRGHRRHAAALFMELAEIPCIVADDSDPLQIALARAAENTARDNFSPVEQANAVQQLLDLGATEQEVAQGLAVDIEHVETARRIADSPAALQLAASVPLSFDQLAAFAEFEGDDDAQAELAQTLSDEPEEWSYRLTSLRQDRRRQVILFDEGVKWQAKGYAQFEHGEYPAESEYIENLKGTGKHALTPEQHAECPGRAVGLRLNWQDEVMLVELCADYEKHGHELIDRPAAWRPNSSARGSEKQTLSPKEQEAATLKRRVNLACIDATKASTVVRREFVSTLLKRKTVPPGVLRFAVDVTMGFWTGYLYGDDVFSELTGFTESTGRAGTGPYRTLQQKFLAKVSEPCIPLALFARVAAQIEKGWEPNKWDQNIEPRPAYIELLVKLGYHPSLVEKIVIGKAIGQDVLNEKELRKVAAKTPIPTSTKANTPVKKAAATVKKVAAKRTPAK